MTQRILLFLAGFLGAAAPALAQAPSQGPETGLPLPRFESLRFDEVNLRRGAGETYPIAWTFVRQGLPVQVFQEYGDWRHVRDHDGATGWIKRTQLSAARTAIAPDRVLDLLAEPDDASRVLARAEPGVVFRLLSCGAFWCRVSAGGYRGWALKDRLWGVSAIEEFREGG